MELRVLHYFLAVAREQSISAAAEALHLSQPALSTQLKAMEEELGKQLMIRGTKGSRRVTLTEEGMILRKRAEEIVSLVEKTKAGRRKKLPAPKTRLSETSISAAEKRISSASSPAPPVGSKNSIRIFATTYQAGTQNMYLNIWRKG